MDQIRLNSLELEPVVTIRPTKAAFLEMNLTDFTTASAKLIV